MKQTTSHILHGFFLNTFFGSVGQTQEEQYLRGEGKKNLILVQKKFYF